MWTRFKPFGRLGQLGWLALLWLGLAAGAAQAQPEGPDALIQRLSQEVMAAIRADPAIRAGDVVRIMALVDAKLMPHVDFRRMTASAVGRHWRDATPEQRERLQAEFKILLVRTYSGALAQVKDQTIVVRPLRAAPGATDVVVHTEVRGLGDPIQLDYRLERVGERWLIYDVNVLGIWLVPQYRLSFGREIAQFGIDGLIERLAERNRAARS
jgi:phospholipid transport system substrate-binding protein